MKKRIKSGVLKVFIGGFIFFLFQMYGVARFVGNFSESSFDEPNREQINTYVIEAAGNFLKSQSNMFLFLNKVEMSDLEGADFIELQSLIDHAVVNMRSAHAKYGELTALADNTPYNQTVLDRLVTFEYTFFKEAKSLNSVIYNDVEAYLQAGDVRGVYHQLYLDTQQILDRLTVLKSDVDAGKLPGIADLWQTNRCFSRTFLFGQYSAEIFYEITGK